MSDLISRRAAITAIDDLPNCYNGYSDAYDKACIIGVLEELPRVDVPDRKVGKWIDKAVSIKGVPTEACSVCGEWSYGDDMSYCPNCGARMENNAEEIL